MGSSPRFKNVSRRVERNYSHVYLADERFRWVANLPTIYAGQGLEKVDFERYVMPPEYLRYDTDKSLTSYEEFSRTILDSKGGDEGQKLRDLVEKASRECEKGVAMTADLVVAVARKPQA